jgi:hypothetical protein
MNYTVLAFFILFSVVVGEAADPQPLAKAVEAIENADRLQIDFAGLQSTLQRIDAQLSQTGSIDDGLRLSLETYLKEAHERKVPLGLILYPHVQGVDPLRQMAIQSTYSSFWIKGGIGWPYLSTMIDSLLAARDAPMEVFTDGAENIYIAMKNWQLESKLRYSVLECLHRLIYSGETELPMREGYTDDLYGPKTLHKLLIAGLNLPSLPPDKKALLKKELAKVDAYIANPPPYAVKSWQDAAERQALRMRGYMDEAVRASAALRETQAKQDLTFSAGTAEEKTMHQNDSTSPINLWVGILVAGAAVALLWMALKKRRG